MNPEQLLEKLHQRRAYFQRHFPRLMWADRRNDVECLPNSCPICGYMTLSNRCCHDICGICFWQDDGSDDIDANESCLEPNNIDAITGERIEWLTFLENKQYPFECAKLETLDALIEADSPHTA